jgi:hypothetical protein
VAFAASRALVGKRVPVRAERFRDGIILARPELQADSEAIPLADERTSGRVALPLLPSEDRVRWTCFN